MTRTLLLSCIVVAAAGCGGGSTTPDAGPEPRDAGTDAAAAMDAHVVPPIDAGRDAQVATDAASSDAAPSLDGGPIDGGQPDRDGGACGAMDAREGEPCGPTERPGTRYRWNGSTCEAVHWCRCIGHDCDALFVAERPCQDAYAGCTGSGGACATDADCTAGSEWCEGGSCVACDNSGLACRIACPEGWSTYTRNGCNPCACAPENDCTNDGECHVGDKCYAGAFCWDWCAPGDASCCYGNLCSAPDCTAPPPVGCRERGCPMGERCDLESGCASSSCFCSEGAWVCTRDCGGGVCVPDV